MRKTSVSKRNAVLLGVILLLLSQFFSGCAEKAQQDTTEIASLDTCQIYCLDKDQQLVYLDTKIKKSADPEKTMEELLDQMQKLPEQKGYLSALPTEVTVTSYTTKGALLTIDFSAAYNKMEKAREVQCRAAYVETVTQLDGINQVCFTIAGEPLTDVDGNEVGIMTEDSFVDNSSYSLRQYEKGTFVLYFADEDGDSLIGEKREIRYSKNHPAAQVVVEQLQKGSESEDRQATIPKGAKLLGVTTRDGICYLNFDSAFADGEVAVSDKMVIYSIVNSVADATGVDKVQISIEGDSNIQFHKNISLKEPFSADKSLVSK